jgi:simple sugar transport system permease protein
MTAGRGFIAIGAIVLGRWNPARVALACFLFGAADALQLRAQTFGFPIPHEFFAMLPYLLTVAALVGLLGRTRPPAQLGIPYLPDRQE